MSTNAPGGTAPSTLWPGESETLHASTRADVRGASPVVSVSGWYVATINARAS